jgi:hypothetical protein
MTASGATRREDLAPNFTWESAAKIGPAGWTLELAIPFSSIRYDPVEQPVWGVTLLRNWPRDFRYIILTAPQPLDAPCFICNENQLVGLEGLPSAGSLVVAPFGVLRRTDLPEGGELGRPLESDDVDGELGLDLKWTPNARHTLDLTVRPDFSQVESDVAQISTNQRFALFFPEQRPFFLEQVDLFSTPIQAVYTRTVTAPRGGLRATGRFGKSSYTFLVSDDRGGGSVVIPGDTSSTFADQDFESKLVLGRLRRDFGQSYLSFLVSDREVDGGGSTGSSAPTSSGSRGADTSSANTSGAEARHRSAPTWPRNGTAASSTAAPRCSTGSTTTATGTGTSRARRSTPSSAPTTATCRRSASPRPVRGGRTCAAGTISSFRPSASTSTRDEDDEILQRMYRPVGLGGARSIDSVPLRSTTSRSKGSC